MIHIEIETFPTNDLFRSKMCDGHYYYQHMRARRH